MTGARPQSKWTFPASWVTSFLTPSSPLRTMSGRPGSTACSEGSGEAPGDPVAFLMLPQALAHPEEMAWLG